MRLIITTTRRCTRGPHIGTALPGSALWRLVTSMQTRVSRHEQAGTSKQARAGGALTDEPNKEAGRRRTTREINLGSSPAMCGHFGCIFKTTADCATISFLVHFWVVYWATRPIYTHSKAQLASLHCSLATWGTLRQSAG